ncbi:hypothetical protein FOL47_006819 [Perkinsus chesapeaki]|uniref:Uncharacterized protein n=1 Tax=Perkinsus chesapeaki TaxID=330153 RepID=A0A7J6MWL5_PERCH|nr:hypothetical protein FOL47_006819 [Perkinsus chesapeaki]
MSSATDLPAQTHPETESDAGTSEGEDIIRKSTRRSKPVDHFAPSQKRKIGAARKFHAGDGKGEKLGDIEVVSKGIGKAPVDGEGLKRLHLCLFNSVGKETTRKRDIRAWNGCQSAEDRERIEKTLKATKKQENLREIARTLGLSSSQSRTVLEESILRFLDVPKDEGLKKPKSKRRASVTGTRKKSKPSTRQGSGFSTFLAQRTKELKATEAGKLLTPKEVTEMLSVEWTSMSGPDKAAFGTPQKAGQKRKRGSAAGKAKATKKARKVSESSDKAGEDSSSDDSSSDSSSSSSSSSSEDSSSEEQSTEESPEKGKDTSKEEESHESDEPVEEKDAEKSEEEKPTKSDDDVDIYEGMDDTEDNVETRE